MNDATEHLRIVSVIMEATYLFFHLIFVIRLFRQRQQSPVYKCFFFVVLGLWGIVGGGLWENLLLLIYQDDFLYALEKDYQLSSTTLATLSFLFFNLYLSGCDRLCENRIFRWGIVSISLAVCAVFCTNPLHRMFYVNLELTGDKSHGALFYPCVFVVYGMLFAGLMVSIVYIIRNGENKLRRVLVFSMYPILPAVTNLLYSILGRGALDLNPLIMTVSLYCLYVIVFRKGYVKMLSQSVESILNQSEHGVAVFDNSGRIIYQNDTMKKSFEMSFSELTGLLDGENAVEKKFGDRFLRITSRNTGISDIQITVTDLTEIKRQQLLLERQLEDSNALKKSLEDKKNNIDAYLDTLYEIPRLKEKQELVSETRSEIEQAFKQFEDNLETALKNREDAQKVLDDNIALSEITIARVRSTVSVLKEGM